MKTAILATVLFIAAVITVNKAEAQLRVNLNVNIGSQPAWGPRGYDYVEYYYLPDIDCYYYVPRHQFVYQMAAGYFRHHCRTGILVIISIQVIK